MSTPPTRTKGVGWRTWQFIEQSYPQARSWSLGTPSYAVKNHRFYEMRGFRHVKTEPDNEHPSDNFVFRKETGPTPGALSR